MKNIPSYTGYVNNIDCKKNFGDQRLSKTKQLNENKGNSQTEKNYYSITKVSQSKFKNCDTNLCYNRICCLLEIISCTVYDVMCWSPSGLERTELLVPDSYTEEGEDGLQIYQHSVSDFSIVEGQDGLKQSNTLF